MRNKLYKEFASSYAAVTNNRDFKAQLELLLNTYQPEQPCQSFIELFAGQSYHSIAAIQKGTMDVWAVDSSLEMKQLAVAEGFLNPEQYIVGDLPGSIAAHPVKFDCVACLYSGLSTLPMQAVYELLQNIRPLLSNKGKVFIELHDIFYTMEYVVIDHIYSAEEISFLANLLNYEIKELTKDPVWANNFPGGIVLELSLKQTS
ncbi:hypothetical protein TH53_14210 [Pedobacter lusitanus]|uniref:Methyltransferase domain-containing protein n=1 Tax=Pedobacter lusitanus TaxID=1503925 RepID=A0A0D0GPY4_9SPHI|nr:hypothetical protein [Pedobacter lusitanus]KIO76591.1 hypothetical protein TH53_14210 [Pedobacter lusitanus]